METTSRNLLAGVAKVVITDPEAGPANDPLYVKALVLRSGDEIAVIVTVDAVAIAEIGSIIGAVRKKIAIVCWHLSGR